MARPFTWPYVFCDSMYRKLASRPDSCFTSGSLAPMTTREQPRTRSPPGDWSVYLLGHGVAMNTLHYDEWMSESDSVLWYIERDPLLRSTITSVWFLDSIPDRARMDAVAARVVERIPRLRQRVVDEQPGVAAPRWADDPHVDLDYHYTWARLPSRRTGRRDVLDFAQHMAARSFDKDRPLWELCV